MLYKKFRPWISLMFASFFLVFSWLSPIDLRNLETLGEIYTFLIILRRRIRITDYGKILVDPYQSPSRA